MFKLNEVQQELLNVLSENFELSLLISHFDVHSNEVKKAQMHSYVVNQVVDVTFLEDDKIVVVFNFDEYEEVIMNTNEVTVDFIKRCCDQS